MKTLIHVVSSGEWGGRERYAFDICRHYLRRGWSVGVLTRDAMAVDCHFRKAGVDIYHAPLRSYPDYYSARTLAMLFGKMPKGEGTVHVHRLNDALTCIMARLMVGRPDIKLVYTRHKVARGKGGLLRRIIYRGIDRFLFVSEFSKQNFLSRWGSKAPVPEDKTAITYNSLLESLDAPAGEPAKGPVVAAYRGSLRPGKGLETIIDALAMLKPSKLRLHIMGRGNPDYVDTLRRRAAVAGVTDRIDWIRNAEFPAERMHGVHFGVLLSEEPEAFGMANLEFMAFGKPQVSCFSGAEKEMLTPGEDSLAVPPADPERLAEAMRRLASDASLRRELGRNALKNYKKRFAWPIFIKKIDRIY